jgi:hypothetical protein
LEKEAVEKSEIHMCAHFAVSFVVYKTNKRDTMHTFPTYCITHWHEYYREPYSCAQGKTYIGICLEEIKSDSYFSSQMVNPSPGIKQGLNNHSVTSTRSTVILQTY